MSERKDIVRIVQSKLGAQATVEQVVDFLVEKGAIPHSRLRMFVIGSEFFRLMGEKNGRTSRDIELELAARYGVSEDWVQTVSRNFSTLGKGFKRGRKKKE